MLAVNLRGDLAKLSDAELAERLEAAWRTYERADHATWWPRSSARGPVHHPRAYRFASVLQGSTGYPLFDILLGLMLSSKVFEPWLFKIPSTARHLSLCEIKDVTAEIERRLKGRKGVPQ